MSTKVYQVIPEALTFCSTPVPLPDSLVLVAEFDGDLETAFRFTNSIEQHWADAEDARLTVHSRTRSTSVGDVMELDGKFYIVAAVGFKELEGYSLPVPA